MRVTGPPLWPQLRRVWRVAWPYRWRLAGACALVQLSAAATLALPLGMKGLLDEALAGKRVGLLDLLALELLALFMLRAVLGFAGQYLMRMTGERIITSLRQSVYAHLHSLDLEYHIRQRIGDLSSRLTNDTEAIRAASTDMTVSAALHVFQLVGSIVVMVVLNWRLSLIVLVVTPLVTVTSRLFSPVLQRLACNVQERTAHCSAVAQEALSAVSVIQAFARFDYETKRYGSALGSLLETVRQSVRAGAFFSSIVSLLFAVSSVALFWFGGREVLAERLTAGDLVAFLFYSQNISQCISVLAGHYASLSAAAGASQRIFELLDTQANVVEAPDAVALPPVLGRVRFDRVSFSHVPGHNVLRDLSFVIEPGETVAVVGPSGAGKTTLLHLVSRFYDPSAGRVTIDGIDLRSVRLQSLREQIAVVSQDVFVFGTTVRENIRYGRLEACDEEVEAAAKVAHAHEFIVAMPNGYETEIGERGVKLSGGQRQRLSIARALLKDARILVLDEATSSIDLVSEAAIQDALERLRATQTTIRVTHRLAGLRGIDRILVMDDGRIVESGTEEELLLKGGLFGQLVAAGRRPVPVEERALGSARPY